MNALIEAGPAIILLAVLLILTLIAGPLLACHLGDADPAEDLSPYGILIGSTEPEEQLFVVPEWTLDGPRHTHVVTMPDDELLPVHYRVLEFMCQRAPCPSTLDRFHPAHLLRLEQLGYLTRNRPGDVLWYITSEGEKVVEIRLKGSRQ